jgi:MFS transporter, FHS family, L-fucose permease
VQTGPHSGLTQLFVNLAPAGLPWLSVYWVLAFVIALLLVFLLPFRFPSSAGAQVSTEERLALLRRPLVWAYFLAVFSYVGLEQGLSNWISEFLSSQHGLNPQTDGAAVISGFWIAMTTGAAFGMVLLKLADSRKVLVFFSGLSFLMLGLAVFGGPIVSAIGFVLAGFSISMMWSILFSLALNSVPSHHGALSGILCTGVIGGALLPLLVGGLGDQFGLRAGLASLFIPLAYLFSVGLWAKPLVTNKTLWKKRVPKPS